MLIYPFTFYPFVVIIQIFAKILRIQFDKKTVLYY